MAGSIRTCLTLPAGKYDRPVVEYSDDTCALFPGEKDFSATVRSICSRDAGWYWSEVHIPGLAVPLKEAARVNECPLVADNRSPDYNPAENCKN